MDFGNLFSFNFFALLLLAFGGSLVHYTKGKVTEGSVLGFGQWLISRSPVKSISTWVLVVGLAAVLALSGAWGVLGWGLAFLGGYCADSLFKRLPAAIETVKELRD